MSFKPEHTNNIYILVLILALVHTLGTFIANFILAFVEHLNIHSENKVYLEMTTILILVIIIFIVVKYLTPTAAEIDIKNILQSKLSYSV